MPVLTAARKAVERREDVVLVTIEVEHAFPSMPNDRVWVALRRTLGALSALSWC